MITTIATFVIFHSLSVTCSLYGHSESGLNYSDFNKYYENYISENDNLEDRETRRNDFIPFNSLTFKNGGVADEKYKTRLKSKERDENKIEWWKKTKKKKLKKKQNTKSINKDATGYQTKSPSFSTSTSSTTTSPTPSTWYPVSSTSNYFSRPLDHQKPIKTSNERWWKDENEISDIKPRTRLPTLTEVSTLFEEFYNFAQYYNWVDDHEKVKRIFMKILEKFATNNISIVDVKKVKNYLQKEIFTVSNSANEAFIDYDIFNRYNFIVSDLVKRKSYDLEHKKTTTTEIPSVLSVTKSVINLLKSSAVVTTTTKSRKPIRWKPGKTPNSSNDKFENSLPYYPQSIGWSNNSDRLELSPIFSHLKPELTHFIDQLPHTYTDDREHQSSNKLLPLKISQIATAAPFKFTKGKTVKNMGMNALSLNISYKRTGEEKLMSPFLVTAPLANEIPDSSLLLSPFLVNNDKELSLSEMKMLINIFNQEDFKPLSPVKQTTSQKKPFDNRYFTQTTRRPNYKSTRRPIINDVTTYRPVPQYLAVNDNMDLADLIANLIVDQIQVDNNGLGNKKLLKLLKVLSIFDGSEKSPPTKPPITPPSLTIPQRPGPPYLPTNYLPPNSLINTPPENNFQSLYQTNFDIQSSPATFKPPKYTETYPKAFDYDKSNTSLFNKMVKDLMSKKRFSTKKEVKKRKKYFPTSSTTKNSTKKKSVVSQNSPSNKKAYTQFNRYKVNVPKGLTKNDQYTLPIDSLSRLEQILPRNGLEERTDPANISYEEFILDLMSNLQH